MDNTEREASGQLCRVGWDSRLNMRDSDCIITNGPTASPGGRMFYHTDTLQRVVYALGLGGDSSLERKRVFANINDSGCSDGMTVDEGGCVQVALFGGGWIEQFSPDGRYTGRISFPCPNITKLAFDGDGLQTVYATTTRKGLTDEVLLREPPAGGLFAFRTPVRGLPSTECVVNLSVAMVNQSWRTSPHAARLRRRARTPNVHGTISVDRWIALTSAPRGGALIVTRSPR